MEVVLVRQSNPDYQSRFTDWLTKEAVQHSTIPYLLDAFCCFLNSEGFEIFRCNLATDTIHPQMTGARHVWYDTVTDPGPINPAVVVDRRQYQLNGAMIDEVFFNSGSQENPQYKASPFYQVELLGELYEPIYEAGKTQKYPLFDDLAVDGCTGYFGIKLNSFAGMLQKMGMSTKCGSGLNPDQISALRWSTSLLTLHLNTVVESTIKNTLSRLYIGKDPGQRITNGMIELGNVVSLEAVIWFSDLRNFTSSSETLGPEELIHSLNDYLGAIVPSIHDNGGEVLKFIGDAVLAIFPISNFNTPPAATESALKAFDTAEMKLRIINLNRESENKVPFQHGVGLHYGTAKYGNIGHAQRLDFTVIGREINYASRLEALTKKFSRSLLCSNAFAANCEIKMLSVGSAEVKGIKQPVEVFVPQTHPE